MRKSTRLLFGVFVLVLAPVPAGAQVYANGAPNGSGGWPIYNDWRAADDFTLNAPATINSIRFWALVPGGGTPAPNIFWLIATGFPGNSVASGLAAATPTLRTGVSLGFNSWQLDIFTGQLMLGPGTYWLALHDGALTDVTDSSLLWESTDQQTGSEAHEELFGQTAGIGGDLAFELYESPQVVPEPVSLMLLGTGLAGVAAARRRRKTREQGGMQ